MVLKLGSTSLYDGARKQFEGISSQAKISMAWVNDPLMRKSLAESDFDFAEFKKNPNGMSVFISVRSFRDRWRWARMFAKTFIERSKDDLNETATGKATLSVFDEFSSMKACPEILELMDTSADYRVRRCIVTQAMDQLEDIYHKAWRRFYAAADVRWFFGVECPFTQKFLSEQLGEEDYVRYVRSIAIGQSRTMQYSSTTGQQTSETHGRSHTRTKGNSWGTSANTSDTHSTSRQESRNYNYRESLIGYTLIRHLPFALHGTTLNRGCSGGSSTSHATNHGSTSGGSDATSEASQTSRTTGHQVSETVSRSSA